MSSNDTYRTEPGTPLTERDELFSTPIETPGLFTFNDAVATVFPDMINRSVPGYTTAVAMTGVLAGRHAREGSNIYDLGCSWGASLLSIARQSTSESCHLIGIDNSEAMLDRARAFLRAELPQARFRLEHADLLDVTLSNASVVVMNYTLQFIAVAEREPLLRRIRDAMMPGDILILSEKLRHPDAELNEYLIELHHDFKRQQGYSDLEIAQKRQALEDVLIPETREQHVDRLLSAGFSRCDVWYQCLNFASMIAIA